MPEHWDKKLNNKPFNIEVVSDRMTKRQAEYVEFFLMYPATEIHINYPASWQPYERPEVSLYNKKILSWRGKVKPDMNMSTFRALDRRGLFYKTREFYQKIIGTRLYREYYKFNTKAKFV